MLFYLGAALLITLLPAHILWAIERRHSDSTMSRSYFPGIFQAFGWGLGMLAARVDSSPRHGAARLIATLWALVSIIFVAFYTANLTATLTVARLEAAIHGPADLYDKSVATVANTTSSTYLRRLGIAATELPTIDDCYQGLRDRNFDAVVFDAPVLHHFVAHQGNGLAVLAGPIFQEEDYGLVFALDSALRKPVDRALLTIREEGTYATIYQRWFGDD
jgi:ABC-type amino acid transport substrate-binding protein